MRRKTIPGIYDFQIFPYALGDVLTWNVRTAMRCEELGRDKVDVYLCLDEDSPSSIYQSGLINKNNYELFFSEIYSAFGTHPKLGDIHIFRSHASLLRHVKSLAAEDPLVAKDVQEYIDVLNNTRKSAKRENKLKRIMSVAGRKILQRLSSVGQDQKPKIVESRVGESFEIRNDYFYKYIHSHDQINKYFDEFGRIPLLCSAPGCESEVRELIARKFAGKKIVPFHLRLRRLDVGYGGDHSYDRDSDFLEWYKFLSEAAELYPDIEFVALGRLQEKPLQLLELPNVSNLRSYGLSLGHELTLMLISDLFIGTSSGFAAFANFSDVPYYITRMNPGSCKAYDIPEGADRLPFANRRQKLIYEQETSDLLMSLLVEGLALEPPRQVTCSVKKKITNSDDTLIDIRGWLNERSHLINPATATVRFVADNAYRDCETAYLLMGNLERVRVGLLDGKHDEAVSILQRMEACFPDICPRVLPFRKLSEIAAEESVASRSKRDELLAMDLKGTGYTGFPIDGSDVDKARYENAWKPSMWMFVGVDGEAVPDTPNPTFRIRSTSQNGFVHSPPFIADAGDGHIEFHFEARNSDHLSRHRIWIFENGDYRSFGEFVASHEWERFSIPTFTQPGKLLEFQIDQADEDQWLFVRKFCVKGASDRKFIERSPVQIGLQNWLSTCVNTQRIDGEGGVGCEWKYDGEWGYAKSQELPFPGTLGLLLRFEAKTDVRAVGFSTVYLFEGPQDYRAIGHLSFDSVWQEYTVLLSPTAQVTMQFQIDFPAGAGTLSVKNLMAVPVDSADEAAYRGEGE